MTGFAERIQAQEEAFLWEPATRSYPAVRVHPEADSPVRTPFQRDRDRISSKDATGFSRSRGVAG